MNRSIVRRLGGVTLVAGLAGVFAGRVAAQQGTVAGQVTDQATSAPIAGARVLLGSTNIAAFTNTQGRYTLRSVPAGSYELRVSVIGFAGASQLVTVASGEIVNADLALKPAAVSLDVIVVTATGEQRSRELGNAVSHVDAPAIAATSPISDLGDLLSGHAGANVQVFASSGTTGAGTKVRIRGQSSLSLSNEPVYYIDGVRMESGSGSIGVGGQTFSRINDINPEEIESVEIIKGPSAATLYGTQAANGVVRITTKRGLAGRPVWTVYSEAGILNDPNHYPTNYFSWGRIPGTDRAYQPADSVRQCLLTASVLAPTATGACTIDSLTSFNVLENKQKTFLGTGYRGQLGAQVSGGSDQARYFFSSEYEDEIGHYRLPDAEYGRILQERQATELPYSQYRPNEVKKVSVRTNVQSQLSNRADVGFNIGLIKSDGRLPQNDNNINGMLPSGLFGRGFEGIGRRACGSATCLPGQDTTVLGSEWGFFRSGDVFSILTEQDISRLIGSANGNWRPTDYLTARATVGIDYTNRVDQLYQALNEGPAFGTQRRGRKQDNRYEITQTTVDLGATASFNLRPDLNSKTSAGAQYLRDWFFGVTGSGSEFAPGGKTVDAGAIRTAGETTTETITLGFYADQLFGWKDRRFLDMGLRVDNNSAFGATFRSAAYPKVQASWVISEEPFFPASLPLSLLRLRAAYGQSGVQPGSTDALRFFESVTATIAATDVPGLRISAVGNDSLKPERSAELEVGFDADLLEGRTHVELTYYNKRTRDALIRRVLPPSLGAAANRFENLGSVRNRGIEGVITTNLNIMPSVGIDLTLSGSRNVNKLLTLGANVTPIIAGAIRQVPGYPLFGYWDRPILGFHDLNGDGIIVGSEVVVGDTAVFIGPSIPRTEFALNGGLTLFKNRLRISGQLDYRGDFKQNNFTDYFRCTSSSANNCRWINDPSTSLPEQARAVAARTGPGFTDAGFIVDGSFLKLRELSLTFQAPPEWAHVVRASRMSLTFTGRNLAKWTKYPGIDPELNGNGQSDSPIDFLTQAPVRYWTFRVNLGF